MLVAAALLLYAPALLVLPVGDDWQYIGMAEQHGLDPLYDLRHFRLWERAAIAAGIHLFGSYGPATIALSQAVFALTALLLFAVARALVPAQRWAPVVALGLYLFHPVNASAVIQMDTLAQSLAGLLTLLTIRQVVFGAPQRGFPADVAGFCLVLCTLLAKETALGGMAWLPFAAWARAHWLDRVEMAAALKRAIRVAGIAGCGIAAYLLLRAAIGVELPTYSTERYSVHWDVALWLRNAAQLTGAAFYYGDTATLLIFGAGGKVWASIALSAVLTLAVAGGLFRLARVPAAHRSPGSLTRIALWVSFLPASLAPVFLLGSVSELYVAALTPFVALGYGVALTAPAAGRLHQLSLLVVAGALVWGAMSITDKLALHKSVADRTWSLLREVSPLIDECQHPVQVAGALTGTTSGGRPYSVYSASNRRLLAMVVASRRHQPTSAALERLLTEAADRIPDRDSVECTLARPRDEACRLQCRLMSPGP